MGRGGQVKGGPHPIDPAAPVAALLAASSLSQGAAAARLGVTRQAVSAAVARGAGVTLGTLVAWAGALGYVVEVRLRRRAPR